MYLSQLILNPHNCLARADMANPYELHRTINTQGFQDRHDKADRILFRLEPFSRGIFSSGVVLVQSTEKPDWSSLIARNGYLLNEPRIKEFHSLILQPGQVFRFRLRANPCKRDAQSKKRLALTVLSERLAWLARKGQQCGFSVDPVMIICRDANFCQFWIQKGKEKNGQHLKSSQATVQMVDYDGLLEVTDPDLLNTAIVKGVGSAKGFGCGLLSLARA